MIYIFKCPVCKKTVRFGYSCEPCCTGPSESRDDHEVTVMLIHEKIDGKICELVNPLEAKAHAAGPLIVPDNYLP